jgi:hypothetical protein
LPVLVGGLNLLPAPISSRIIRSHRALVDVAGVFELDFLQIFFALLRSRCYSRIILQPKLSSRPTSKDVAKGDKVLLINCVHVHANQI